MKNQQAAPIGVVKLSAQTFQPLFFIQIHTFLSNTDCKNRMMLTKKQDISCIASFFGS